MPLFHKKIKAVEAFRVPFVEEGGLGNEMLKWLESKCNKSSFIATPELITVSFTPKGHYYTLLATSGNWIVDDSGGIFVCPDNMFNDTYSPTTFYKGEREPSSQE